MANQKNPNQAVPIGHVDVAGEPVDCMLNPEYTRFFESLHKRAGGTTPPTVTGSRGGNAALASLLTTLATLGLITDGTIA